MAYSTPAMVRDAVNPTGDGTQTTNTHTPSDLSDAALTEFIAEADSIIDGYIGKFYTVPVVPVVDSTSGLGDGTVSPAIPHPVDFWSRNIALYNAYCALRKSQDFADQDPIARRYSATLSMLQAVAAGHVKLQLPDNFTTAAGAGAGPPINPGYIGNLWGTEDFNLHPINGLWPLWPDNPGRPW